MFTLLSPTVVAQTERVSEMVPEVSSSQLRGEGFFCVASDG